MTAKETKHAIVNLAIETWMKPCFPNGFERWLRSTINEEEILDRDDDYKQVDDFDETELVWLFVAFLYEKKYINEAQAKLLCKGNEFGSSCYGEWRDVAKKKLGVRFSK